MKKILVVLLILAVGTGVFAQGTWTIGGGGQIGARVDFDPDPKATDDVATVRSTGYSTPYDQYSATSGNVTIGYSLGGFTGAVLMHTSDGLELDGNLKGENYRFQIRGFIASFLNKEDSQLGNAGTDWTRTRRLWGEYKLINGMVTLEAAYNSRDTEYWVSDKTGAFLGDDAANGKDFEHHNFGDESNKMAKSFTKVDHHNYLLGNVTVAGLDLGMILPNFFVDTVWNSDQKGWESWTGNDVVANKKLIDDVLKQAVIGAKFTMSPIEVAMQLKMKDYGVYFGGRFFAGPITAGLSFMGLLNPDATADSHMKAGASVEYAGGGFGAALRGKFDTIELAATPGDTTTTIGVEPEFFYNAIPTHLQFRLNTGFYFQTKTAGGVKGDMETYWGLQPQIFWNFLGTGAGTWYSGLNTGMIVRYRIFKDVTNALDLVFKFSL